MESPGYIILSRQTALQRELSIVANNIANVNTTGFKAEMALYDKFEVTDNTGRKHDFVVDLGSVRDLGAGAMQQTGNPFDLAIGGEGFFAIAEGTETFYTRNGSFAVDNEGKLVTRTGGAVLNAGDNPILLPVGSSQITITKDGLVQADGEEVGTISVVSFENPQDMKKRGNGYLATEQEAKPVEKTNVLQGMLEGSNVQSMTEITKLIDIHRAYERASKIVKQEDERQRDVIRRLGRPAQA